VKTGIGGKSRENGGSGAWIIGRRLPWQDVDLHKRQLCVARSEWKGHITQPKRGRLRYVPLTQRLATALTQSRHLKSKRVLCDARVSENFVCGA